MRGVKKYLRLNDDGSEWAEKWKQYDIQNNKPVKVEGYKDKWYFKGIFYEVDKTYNEEEAMLLVLESFDAERRLFERLKQKFNSHEESVSSGDRRIPENVRIEVWRRDGGRCARCGSREKLEYDHIIPFSRGGTNTARNIELLCENCNRTKKDNIV
jgi:hypothetical protein